MEKVTPHKSAQQDAPARYGQFATSGLKFEVEPTTNTFNSELED